MALTHTDLAQRAREDWLIGGDSQKWADLANQRVQELTQRSTSGTQPIVLLTEADPEKFLASFVAACVTRSPLFLGNHRWGEGEWQQVFEQVQPDIWWGDPPCFPPWQGESESPPELGDLGSAKGSSEVKPAQPGWIMIPTGGSSGKIKFVIHTWETLTASVQGFRSHFQVDRVHSCCALPLYHVSGLMQFMRSFISGGRLALTSFKALESGEFPAIRPEEFFISLVPTQLQRSLSNPALYRWLSSFQTVLLGGAAAWDDLLQSAHQHHIPLALTYGMTETASQITALHPQFFLQGCTSSGTLLPHAQITPPPVPEPAKGSPIARFLSLPKKHSVLEPAEGFPLQIHAASLALGYYPDRFFNGTFCPDDLGYFDAAGELHLVGRSSDKIITGGENVVPAEVEAAIRATGLVQDVCVLGLGDRHWGEIVAAVYVPASPTCSTEALSQAIRDQLSRYKQPKRWLALETMPRNAQGKINRAELRELFQKGESFSGINSV